jgi:hypothetical protein
VFASGRVWFVWFAQIKVENRGWAGARAKTIRVRMVCHVSLTDNSSKTMGVKGLFGLLWGEKEKKEKGWAGLC